MPSLEVIPMMAINYVYGRVLNKNEVYDRNVYLNEDYYYDLTDSGSVCSEIPVALDPDANIDSIFLGKSCSRHLFSLGIHEFKPNSRVGNTLIFNRKLLDIPNMSIAMGDTIARRSDFFWVLEAEKLGYKVIGSSFSTFHNRIGETFDYKKEEDKEIKDLIGSSFTKAFTQLTKHTREEFFGFFCFQYKKRLSMLIENYFRIIGLLSIVEDQRYCLYYNENGLKNLVRIARKHLDRSLVESSFDYVSSLFSNHLKLEQKDIYIEELEKEIGVHVSDVLGIGNEGIVLTDKKKIYKVFYSKIDRNVYHRFGRLFGDCKEMDEITLFETSHYSVISYKYEDNYKPYEGGYAFELADLLRFLKKNGLVLSNIKRTNFLIINGHLKYIDYGKNIESYSEEKFDRSVERSFQMLRYPSLSLAEYKQMISLSYLHDIKGVNFGIEAFQELLKERYKEQIHDPMLVPLLI